MQANLPGALNSQHPCSWKSGNVELEWIGNLEKMIGLVALIDKGVASLIILSSAGYSWGREAEKQWAEIWNLTHKSWS